MPLRSQEVTVEMVRRWFVRAVVGLRKRESEINRINVFPVPDADTGSNMLGTLESALRSLEAEPSLSFKDSWHALAEGALMGARGNSGVILAAMLRGFSDAAENFEAWSIPRLQKALEVAHQTARAQVRDPHEGTILTVAQATAEGIGDAKTVEEALLQALESGRRALRETPLWLPTLHAHGVVDAGAAGFLVILESWYEATVDGEEIVRRPPQSVSVTPSGGALEIPYPYDVEALLAPHGGRFVRDTLTHQLEALGDSIVVAEGSALIKVHVHTDRPVELMALLTKAGTIQQLEMLDMRVQVASRPSLDRLVIVADERYHPLFEHFGTVVSPEVGTDRPGSFWVKPPRAIAEGFAVDSVALAGQLLLVYQADTPWRETVEAWQEARARIKHVPVYRDPGGYRLHGEDHILSREELAIALRDGSPQDAWTTVYLSQRAKWEEATFWQKTLNAELVQVPDDPVWMEVVWES